MCLWAVDQKIFMILLRLSPNVQMESIRRDVEISMFSRRAFIVTACCVAHQSVHNALGSEKSNVFVCSTPDDALNSIFSIDEYKIPMGSKLEIDNSIKKFSITPYGTAFYKDRWLPSDGLTPSTGLITLGVSFLNGTDSQKQAVVDAASVWTGGTTSNKLVFSFGIQASSSQIRVEFDAPANDSYIGRQNLSVDKSLPTLRIHDNVSTVIQHEFGHALGLQHEQQFPDQTIIWNEKAVIDEMAAAPNYWSASTTRANILTKYTSKDAVCIGDRKFNEKSIMLYPIPSRWTTNGFSVGTNQSISDGDIRCLKGLYGI
jgi:hypothetical protein